MWTSLWRSVNYRCDIATSGAEVYTREGPAPIRASSRSRTRAIDAYADEPQGARTRSEQRGSRPYRLLDRLDANRHDRIHALEQVNPYLVRSGRADRLVEMDVVPVESDARLALDLGRDLGRGDTAEELALLAHARLHGDRRAGELGGDRLGLGLRRRHANRVRPLETVGVPHPAARRLDREPTRDEVVARVAVGNLDDVAGVTELFDALLQDDLHRVEYGSSATSRAFLTADATSRWCCAQLPVTRRARIFPRSETNFRSVGRSL